MKQAKKAAAALMSGLLALQGIPQFGIQAAEDDIYVTDFEDGDVSAFSKRGDTDTSVIEACTEDAHSGTTCMSVTERSEGWNGPSLTLSTVGCEPGVQYLATAWVKMAWYNTVNLSMQYTDAEGEQHYSNLASVTTQGEWVQIPLTKFSFSADMLDVSIYIEGSDKAEMWVDDFSLTAAPVHPIQQDIPSLKDVYADYFKIGGAVTAQELAPQSTKNLILKHYNSLTLGNELKPENMLDQKASQAYLAETGDNTVPQVKLNGSARIILDFCRDNNIPVRGHVLVWHSQTPGWFFKEDYTSDGEWVDKATMTKRMEAYIKGVFEALEAEYSDVDFYAWDVVNEAWLDDGKPRNPGVYDGGTSNSGWTQIWGDNSFIELAFEYARKYAPKGCKLYYNDYNEYMPQKLEAIINMATELKEKGLIDGIGMQSHLDVRSGSDAFPSAQVYESALAKYAATGLDIQVTELDATVASNDEAGFKAQAQYYSDIMDAIVKYADAVSAVVFWGTTDDQSWRASQTPLLFNEDYTAKPAFDAIVDGIEYTTTEPQATTTKASGSSATTTQTTPASNLRGDADCSGTVDVSDAVLLARYVLADPDAEISDQGKINADVDGAEGLTTDDVVMIVRSIAGLIDLEPAPLESGFEPPENVYSKPTITVGWYGGRAGETVPVTVYVFNSSELDSSWTAGMRVVYEGMEAETNSNGRPVTKKGVAGGVIETSLNSKKHIAGIMYSGNGKDGEMFTINLKIPEDAVPGTVYQIRPEIEDLVDSLVRPVDDKCVLECGCVAVLPDSAASLVGMEFAEPTDIYTEPTMVAAQIGGHAGETVAFSGYVFNSSSIARDWTAGFRLIHDKRLTVETNDSGKPVIKNGKAASVGLSAINPRLHLFGFLLYSKSSDGDMFTVNFTIPEDAVPGTVYPIRFELEDLFDSKTQDLPKCDLVYGSIIVLP